MHRDDDLSPSVAVLQVPESLALDDTQRLRASLRIDRPVRVYLRS
jgi:hypothetical protein